jgi:serine/threonine-protein kinase
MSPEQALGSKELGPASDVWSLGVVLYEILAGRLPVDGNTAGEIVSALMRGHILPLASVLQGAPQSLCWFTDRALAPKPQDRFRDAGELLTALEQTRRALLGGDLGSAPTMAGASSRPSFPGPEAFAPTAFAPGFSAPPPRPIPSHAPGPTGFAPTGFVPGQPKPRASVSPLVWVGMLGILLVSLLALVGGGLAWAASRGVFDRDHAARPTPQTGATSKVQHASSVAPPAPSAPAPPSAASSNGLPSTSDGDPKVPGPSSRGAGTGKGPAPSAPAASASAPAAADTIPYPSGWRVAAYRSSEQKPADLATFRKREPQVVACLQAGALSRCAGVIDPNLTCEIQLDLDRAGTVKAVAVRPLSCMVNNERVHIDRTALTACVSRALLGYSFGAPSHDSKGEFLHFESPVRWR